MDVYTPDEFMSKWEVLKRKIRNEPVVFIYPTDTIYGIGCNALNDTAVKRVREIKKRYDKPFSVIAPSMKWVNNNCILTKESISWLDKLPGPYTYVFRLKNENAISRGVTMGGDTVAVRMPDNWFSKLVSEIGVPIVTTSVNKTGEDYMTSYEDMDEDIKKAVDFLIYEGARKGSPSTIVSFIDDVVIKER